MNRLINDNTGFGHGNSCTQIKWQQKLTTSQVLLMEIPMELKKMENLNDSDLKTGNPTIVVIAGRNLKYSR